MAKSVHACMRASLADAARPRIAWYQAAPRHSGGGLGPRDPTLIGRAAALRLMMQLSEPVSTRVPLA
jgi:hypothetical protein